MCTFASEMRQIRILSGNYILIAFFLLVLIVAGTYSGIGIWKMLLLSVVYISGIIIPGFLLLRWLGLRLKNNTSMLLTACGVGYVVMAVIYALFLICGIQHLSGWFIWILSGICLLSFSKGTLRKDLKVLLFEGNNDVIVLLTIFLITLVLCFVLFRLPIRSVEITGYQDIPYDQMYWMKNSVAATKGFPLPELSVSGLNMYWHMFSCFNIALFHYATGVEIFGLCFSLSYVWHIMLLSGGVYALANELLKERRFVFFVVVLTLLCSSAEYYTDVLYLVHLYYCTLGTPNAIATELLSFLILLKSIEGGRVNWRIMPLLVILVAATVGYKSPIGLILLVGVGCTLVILGLRHRTELLSSIGALMLISLLSIMVLKIFVASDDTLVSAHSNNQVALTFRTAIQTGLFQGLVPLLSDVVGIEIHIVSLILAIPFLLMAHPIIPLMAIVLFSFFIFRKRISFSDDVVLYVLAPLFSMCVTGMAAFLAFTHSGFAQAYFMYAVIPFAILFTQIAIENYFCGSWCRHGLWIFVGCSFLIMPISALTYVYDEEFRHDPKKLSCEGTSTTVKEWLGLSWAKENLPESAVIVSNKVLAPVRGNRSYITSSYAERQVFFEGYISTNLPNDYIVRERLGLVARYFSGDLKAREELKKEGVTHVVVFKTISFSDRATIDWAGDGIPRTLVFNSLSDVNIRKGTVLYENEEIKVLTL